jgi:hypothetical protein
MIIAHSTFVGIIYGKQDLLERQAGKDGAHRLMRFIMTKARLNESLTRVADYYKKSYTSKLASTCFLISILISSTVSHSVFSPEL